MSAGVLCEDQIKEMIAPKSGQTIRLVSSSSQPFKRSLVGLSAIDLPLGDQYWEMQGSCRTGKRYKVADLVRKYANHQKAKPLTDKAITLKRRQVYLFKADCHLDLTSTAIEGKATGKSSIGRLDCLVRLLVDESDTFDLVQKDKRHDLFVEVTPISFHLEVRRGTSLSQLRLYKGNEADISITREELFHEEDESFP